MLLTNALWISAHLFWPGSLDELLRQCVAPLVAHSLRQRWATAFFFIRYAEPGPHIRLRLKLAAAANRSQLEVLIEQQFTLFRKHQFDNRSFMLPDVAGSEVHFVAYEPETERYGDAPGLPVAEDFFAASSRVVLAWLKAQGPQAPAHRLTAALTLHTGFAAVSWPPAEAAAWLRRYTTTWLPHDPAAGLTSTEEQQYWDAVFAERYQQHRPALEVLVAEQWQRVVAGGPRQPAWLAAYAAATRQAHGRYREVVPDPARRQEIYASLLHMTNNRLGVPNHDEAFVAYLLGAAIQPLAH